jgi:lipid-A-disaccharide synthase
MSRAGPLFFIVAGEASGDALAAGLIRQLRNHFPEAEFVGVAGPRMEAAGCASLAAIESLSLFGISEVIGQIPRLLRLRNRLYRAAKRLRPDVFVGVDVPEFNTRLEQRLRGLGITTVHYVCPTVWAWRVNRVRAIRQSVDLLLAIFPFEPDFLAEHGIPATFVGHPLADEPPTHANKAAARAALALDSQARWVGLLPGSRGAEASRLGKRFLAAARWLAQRDPSLRFVVPLANDRVRALFEADLAAFPDLDVVRVAGQARAVMQAADVLLVASGTATLEALLANTPMVVAYEVSPVNYWIARLLKLIKTDLVSMPNLLAGRRLVPELLQQDAQAPMLGAWLYRLLHSASARLEQTDGFAAIHENLARDADASAAAVIARLVETRH